MVPLVPLVHLDPPWTAIFGVWLHEVVQAGSRWSRGGPETPAGPCIRKKVLVDQGGPERSWSTTQHHGPAGAPGPPLDHLHPAWSTSCKHTPEIAVQGGSRWTTGTTGTMELDGEPGALWSHFYILLMWCWEADKERSGPP